jgi:hypothetical protein
MGAGLDTDRVPTLAAVELRHETEPRCGRCCQADRPTGDVASKVGQGSFGHAISFERVIEE